MLSYSEIYFGINIISSFHLNVMKTTIVINQSLIINGYKNLL